MENPYQTPQQPEQHSKQSMSTSETMLMMLSASYVASVATLHLHGVNVTSKHIIFGAVLVVISMIFNLVRHNNG